MKIEMVVIIMSKKRFFIDKINNNQYGIYDRLKMGDTDPLIYSDWTVSLDFTQGVCDLLNDCDNIMNEFYEKVIIGDGSFELIDKIKNGDKVYGMIIKKLFKENIKLKEEIKTYPINEQYAEEIIQQNKKLRIERNKLKKENDDLLKSIKEYKKLRKRLNKNNSRLIEKIAEEFMRWEDE